MSDKIGERINELRNSKNMTLEQLGQNVGVGKSTVRKWETGAIANMRRDKIEKLASALDVSIEYLMGLDEGRKTSVSSDELSLLRFYRKLNAEGRQRALQQLEDLTYIPRYTEPSPEASEKHFA